MAEPNRLLLLSLYVNFAECPKMQTDICIDANVFLACYTSEAHQEDCLNFLQRAQARMLNYYEPALVLYEVASTLHRKVVKQELDLEDSKEALEAFFQLPLLFQWQQTLLTRAANLASRLAMDTSYDCTYLAVAEYRNIPLVTLDQELLKKGRRVYSQVFTVSEFTKKFLR